MSLQWEAPPDGMGCLPLACPSPVPQTHFQAPPMWPHKLPSRNEEGGTRLPSSVCRAPASPLTATQGAVYAAAPSSATLPPATPSQVPGDKVGHLGTGDSSLHNAHSVYPEAGPGGGADPAKLFTRAQERGSSVAVPALEMARVFLSSVPVTALSSLPHSL